LARVKPAGGEVYRDKVLLSEELGYIAYIEDTEGNTIGLHGA